MIVQITPHKNHPTPAVPGEQIVVLNVSAVHMFRGGMLLIVPEGTYVVDTESALEITVV